MASCATTQTPSPPPKSPNFVYCPRGVAPAAKLVLHPRIGRNMPLARSTTRRRRPAQQIAGGSIVIGRFLIVDGLIALTVLWALSPMTPWLIAIAALVVEIFALARRQGACRQRRRPRSRPDYRTRQPDALFVALRADRQARPDDGQNDTGGVLSRAGRVYDSHCAQLGGLLPADRGRNRHQADGWLHLTRKWRARADREHRPAYGGGSWAWLNRSARRGVRSGSPSRSGRRRRNAGGVK